MKYQAYLKRIGYVDQPQADLATLTELHRLHAFAIPFENFDVHLNKGVELNKQHVMKKLVELNRGGYCYELNGAFHDLLCEIGFNVKYLTSRPMFGYEEVRPKTHMILLVDIDGVDYLVDLGFTGLNIIEPIPLSFNIEHWQAGFGFRIIQQHDPAFCEKAEATYIMQTCLMDSSDWLNLFSFDLVEQAYVDYILPNHFNCTSHLSICTHKLIAAIYKPNGRVRLVDNQVKCELDNQVSTYVIQSAAELKQQLLQWFGLAVDDEQSQILFDVAMT
ncbi:hypothetical protein C2869_08560 [Saccharobesus litoralis]|uniref:Arylamine N-acetyltransferase n=1 Tax=Saccharobesus litoralis TaxID=2172099 RepID=A0A2S0VQI0_9ALTE|nr:arylamine N-acetyltransferase [Saccharobesus litoralis]AWB66476.1 hypothetical protein C2869_08560 [Saccharobesus litoralis]